MFETSPDGVTHNGWTVRSRNAGEIQRRIDVARWSDSIGAMFDDSPKRLRRYFAIRYRTDGAYILTGSDIQTRAKYRPRRQVAILSHPKYPKHDFFGPTRARTRLGQLG